MNHHVENILFRISVAPAVFKDPTSVHPAHRLNNRKSQINWLKRALLTR